MSLTLIAMGTGAATSVPPELAYIRPSSEIVEYVAPPAVLISPI